MTKRILLVDDERSIREALRKVLEEEGYDVVEAESGPEAVMGHGERRVDLLLLDLNLPGGNGWGTLEWLTKVNPLLPVIIITGRSNQRELAQRSGADALMEKPLDVPALLATIRELVGESMDVRARRAAGRKPGFRFFPCDDRVFRDLLVERFTVPYALPRAG